MNKPPSNSFAREIHRIPVIIKHWGWLLILGPLVAGIIAFSVSQIIPPTFEASSLILVVQSPSERNAEYNAVLTSERLARTYSQLLLSLPVVETVRENLQLNMSIEELRKTIRVDPILNTQLIKVMVQNSNPQMAANIANELVKVFSALNQSLQTERFSSSKDALQDQITDVEELIQTLTAEINAAQDEPDKAARKAEAELALSEARQSYASLLQSFEQIRMMEAQSSSQLLQVEAAVAPAKPVSPRVMLNTAVALILGFVLAAAIALLGETLDDRLKSTDEISELLNLPVLGTIAYHSAGEDAGVIAMEKPLSPVTEAFRTLRTNLQFASIKGPLRVLLITSDLPEAGKTTVVSNLATVIAQNQKKVLVIDADLRRPKLHLRFSVSNSQGLTDFFVNPDQELTSPIKPVSSSNLSILPSGPKPPNPSELLGSERMELIQQHQLEQYDLIILDTPPVSLVTDAVILSQHADGVLLVFKIGHSRKTTIRETVEQFNRSGVHILGVVVNGVSGPDAKSYKAYYGTPEEADNEKKRPSPKRAS
jgi:non-specific protein-tyrosine kinase